jgi:glycosyltransferase involved in cell wall biosynthesis
VGGLGRHLQEVLDALERQGEQRVCICEEPDAELPQRGHISPKGAIARALTGGLAPLTRLSPAWRTWAASVAFDEEALLRLTAAKHLIAFNGTALAQLEAARGKGYDSASLIAANSHYRQVLRQHAVAQRNHPGIEPPWVTHLLERNLAEYAQADRIYVSTQYIRESFLEQGHEESRLLSFPLTPDPRYRPAAVRSVESSTFDILYIGSLSVHKGVPLLLDAFRQLPHPEMRLKLLGGWSTRGMRQLIERACAEDPRVSAGPGDPLSALGGAQLCVHPAYEDGFAYAPAEALACGVPVLVSEDTGMKELIDPGVSGLVLPTGDLGSLTEAIEAVHRGEMLSG